MMGREDFAGGGGDKVRAGWRAERRKVSTHSSVAKVAAATKRRRNRQNFWYCCFGLPSLVTCGNERAYGLDSGQD